jgi:hypothetical protein
MLAELQLLALIVAGASAARLNGLNFLNGQWSPDKFDSPRALESLDTLRNTTGANAIALTVRPCVGRTPSPASVPWVDRCLSSRCSCCAFSALNHERVC